MSHLHLPQRDDPDHCGNDGCGLIWSDPVHAPSVALRKLQELPPDLRPLAATERASGAPSVPSQRSAAPATHTGRPAFHSSTEYIPESAKWLMCPERFRTPGRPTLQCPFSTPLRAEMADHLARTHSYKEQAAGFYLAHPWFANEQRSDWVKRTASLRGSHVLARLETPEVCTHPNGFGPNGCPCGKGQPGEDEPETVRVIDTGKDIPATRCPECHEAIPTDNLLMHMREVEASDQEDIDAMAELLGLPPLESPDESPIWSRSIHCPVREQQIAAGERATCPGRAGHTKATIREHLQTAHQWTGDMWEDWAESVNFLELPTVPKQVLDEMARFLNPDVTMEDIMADAADTPPTGNEHKLDPTELEQILTGWWMDKANEEASAVVPKAVEYGATDLRDIGRDLADCMGRTVTDQEATELGIFFYLRGKLSRWVDAVKRGDRPSDDTIYDIGVYCRMAQRNRDAGGWPGLPKD